MTPPRWQRLVARAVLVTFTTSVVACGGSGSETPTTTTAAAEVTTTSEAPTTIPQAPPPTLPAQPPQQLSKKELRDLVAPVALYPDVVLSSLLPATTNPEQVHDAAQFVGQAEQVDRIPDDRGWDGSVVGLLQFPDVLRWLDANPAWTDEMGQAVTYQQGDVLDAIQDYRHAVANAGNLKSNQYQTVRAPAPDQDIRIEPARPDIVYVPSYDPVVAVEPQPPPSPGINPWIAFGGGALVGALGAWALYSIFDDDDDHYHYGGRRHIRAYDNYYYHRGRRPRVVEWTPRPRPWRAPRAGWQQPRRLEYARPAGRPARRAAALRPPMNRPGTQAPRPAEVRREQKQQRQLQRQETKQERQQQRQENRQEQKLQRQEKRQDQQQQRRERQEQRQQQERQQQEQRQQRRQEQRQQQKSQQQQRQEQQRQQQERRQQQRQEQQQQEQQRREQQRQEQQRRQQERQEQERQRQEQQRLERQEQQQQREQRQEQRQEQRREQRQENQAGGGQGQNGKKKKDQQKDEQ